MRLTKLELTGFKSFARKTELVFPDGITAIIGPNGSGKSNLADAVRWVLGEQSAKALRGTKMEDVIFGGTQQKKQLSYCEVTLTFDNSDGLLPVAFSEVAVTRRVYRSGESEYCINKNNCRLKDIQDLFHDTGIGKDGYSIIGQGKVDEILANKSNDRRTALEEAAGVMRYRVRKEEASRKLDHTEKNLERISDILSELSDRLGPLEEQSRTAREYLKLRDELKDLEVNLFLTQYERYHERIRAAADAMEAMEAERALESEKEQAALSACAALEERIHVLDASLSEQQNKLIAALSGVEARVGECNLLLERRDHAIRERERLEAEGANLRARLDALEQSISGNERLDAQEDAIFALDAEIAADTEKLSAFDGEIRNQEDALERMKAEIIERMNRLSDAKSLLSHYETMVSAFRSRADDIDSEIALLSNKEKTLQREQREAGAALAEFDAEWNDMKRRLAEAQSERTGAETAYAAAERDMRAAEQELAGKKSRLSALTDMARAREGYFDSVKRVMQDAERDSALKKAVVGVVAELVSVPKEYETAITMTMGSALQNIVTETAEDAKLVIEYLRRKDYGRATLLPLNLMHPPVISERERGYLSGDGCIGIASELITCDPRIRPAVEFLLGRTAIVRDLDSGIQLKKRAGGAFHISTLEGDVISTGGAMTGGGRAKKSFSLLSREREISELNEAVKRGEARRKALLADCEQMKEKLLLLNAQIDAFQSALFECEIKRTKQKEKVDIISRDISDNGVSAERLRLEKQGVLENIEDLAADREQAISDQTHIESSNESTRADVAVAQKQLLAMRADREKDASAITEKKLIRLSYSKERDAAQAERKRLTAECDRLRAEAERGKRSLAQLSEQIADGEQKLSEMRALVSTEQTDAEKQKKAQQTAEDERQQLSEELTKLRADRETRLYNGRELAEKLHKQELVKNRLEMEIAGMQDHIWEEYELTYENALPLRRDVAVGATNARMNEIKTEIKSLGEINVGAIDDYRAVFERHSALSTQHDDLVAAKADLQSLIVELTATMEKVFLTQFARIQQNFSEVFSSLFGGGTAEIRLADPADALNCDIDIIAQPPGKKLQLLSLLSGGERAMTAIALLFAMLRIKPPAFCLLDEIESSLDEANVSRFADFLQRYSQGTQFLLITHRKGSMEVCNTLYGVTMEEKGVSKIVSARFEEVS